MKTRQGSLIAIFLLGSLMFSAQAQQPQPQQSPAPQAAAPADAKKPTAPEPPKDKAFADIVKDAQVIKGLFTLYRTEEKVFLELLPEQLEKTYLVSLTVDSGIGERGFYAAAMAGEAPIVFHKQGKNVQLVFKNSRFYAQEGPMSRAVGSVERTQMFSTG